eukprot:760131-Hanusia_phi.AAC.1
MLDDRDLRQMMPLSYVAAPYRPLKAKVVSKLRSKARRLAREKLHGQEEEEEEKEVEKKTKKDMKNKRGRDSRDEDLANQKRRKFDTGVRESNGKHKSSKESKAAKQALSNDRLASYTMHKKSEASGGEERRQRSEGGVNRRRTRRRSRSITRHTTDTQERESARRVSTTRTNRSDPGETLFALLHTNANMRRQKLQAHPLRRGLSQRL